MPATSKPGGTSSQRPERRRNPREYAKSLVYVELGDNNGGIALNFSESGISVQAANAISEENIPVIRFQLPHSHLWIQTSGRVIWTSESQTLVAIEFTGLSEKSLEQIRQWLAFESKIDISGGLAPASPDLPVGPRESTKSASALASMLAHDPAFTKMEDDLLEPSEISTYSPPKPPVLPLVAEPSKPPEPLAEVHVEPAKPEPLPPAVTETFQAPPKHIMAERERTRVYEPPPRVYPGSASSRRSEPWQPEKRREVTPSIPIDPEVEEAQEEIRQIIASGEEARSRTILGRIHNPSTKRPAEKPNPATAGSRQPNSQNSSPADLEKKSSRPRESAFNRTAVRIELPKPERAVLGGAVSPGSSKSANWTLPVLLGILVALLGVLLWLGARGSISALFGRAENSPAQDLSTAASAPSNESKDFQIEVVDAKGRRRAIPAVDSAPNHSSQKAAPPPQ